MDIKEIIRIVGLIKEVNCTNWALVSETASEMGVKKTALMQYIDGHRNLFRLIKVSKRKGAPEQLAISFCYENPEQNPDSPEWLAIMKAKWAKRLHVSAKDYYGVIEFYFFAEDSESSGKRAHLWRNTHEKMSGLVEAGILKKNSRCYGGLSDCYNWEGYLADGDNLESLAKAGWTTDFDEVRIKND